MKEVFFFEKKNQKTFPASADLRRSSCIAGARRQWQKVSASFFKRKRFLPACGASARRKAK
jgi:ribulose kinase